MKAIEKPAVGRLRFVKRELAHLVSGTRTIYPILLQAAPAPVRLPKRTL